jgi:FAD:protein FMN transferase
MKLHQFVFKAMACDNELRIYAPDAQAAQTAADKAIAEVRRIETTYSRYRDDSIISRINQAAGKQAVAIDEETNSLLDFADAGFRDSGGLFDITSGVLRRIWDFKIGIPPGKKQIESILPLIGWDKVEYESGKIRLPLEGMEIDFGGIGKEYAADRAADMLRAEGIEYGLVNLGGDISVLGPHPDGTLWDIHIAHPRQQNAIVATIRLGSGALATSGDYLRYFDFGGTRYCHILNPRTGWPADFWQSSTVIAPQCSRAGQASTSAMLLGDKAGPYLAERGLDFLLVDQQGRLHQKSGTRPAQKP